MNDKVLVIWNCFFSPILFLSLLIIQLKKKLIYFRDLWVECRRCQLWNNFICMTTGLLLNHSGTLTTQGQGSHRSFIINYIRYSSVQKLLNKILKRQLKIRCDMMNSSINLATFERSRLRVKPQLPGRLSKKFFCCCCCWLTLFLDKGL